MTRASTYTLREARAADAAALTALAIRSKAYWGYDAPTMAVFRKELALGTREIEDWVVVVLSDARKPVGFYALAECGEETGEVERLFVEPTELGRGHGRQLLDDAVARARSLGWQRLVIASDPFAEGFYLCHGAVRVGRIRSSIPGRSLPLLHLYTAQRDAFEGLT